MNTTSHTFRSAADKQHFAQEFIHEFMPGGVMPLDVDDVLTTLGHTTHASVVTAVGYTLSECVRVLTASEWHAHRLLVAIQAADTSALPMSEMKAFNEWLSSLPNTEGVIWGVSDWPEATDRLRITVLS